MMFFKINKQKKSEKIFHKTIAKHNKLLENDKALTSKKEISLLEKIIIGYSRVLELSPKQKNALKNRGLARSALAKIYMNLEKDDKALAIFDLAMMDLTQALYLDETNVDTYMYMAVVNYGLYEIYKKMSKNDVALHHLQYVMEDHNTLLNMVDKNQTKFVIAEKALVEFDLAELYLFTNQDKALTHFGNSIGHYLENFGKISEQNDIEATFNMGLAESKIATIYKERKEYHFAGISLESSNKYFIKLLDYSLEESSFTRASILYDISMNMSEMGKMLEYLEDYDNAIMSHKESIVYAEKSLLIEPFELETLSNLASSKVDIAKNYLLLNQNREAIIFFNEGIDDFLTLLSSFKKDVISLNTLAMTYTELANIYRYEMIKEQDESIMEKAKEAYLKSEKYYDLSLKIDTKDIPTYVNQAGNYTELAKFHIFIKENKNSIEASSKSLDKLFEVLKIDNNLDLTTNIHATKLNLSEAYERDNQFDKALEVLKGVDDKQSSKNRASILAKIGNLYTQINLESTAIEFFDKALAEYLIELDKYPNRLGQLENISLLFENILKISNEKHYIDKVIWCNVKIIDIYDNYFIDIGFEEDAFSVTEKMSVALERLLDAYIISKLDGDKNLIEMIEKVKAKRLKQLMISNSFEKRELSFSKDKKITFEQLKIKLEAIKRAIVQEEIGFFDIEKQNKLYEEFQDYSQQLSKLLALDNEEDINIYTRLENEMILLYPMYNKQKLTIVSVHKIDGKIEVKISQTILDNTIQFSSYLLFIKYIEELFKKNRPMPKNYLDKLETMLIDDEIKEKLFNNDGIRLTEEEFLEYKYEILPIALSHISKAIVDVIPKEIKKILFAPFGDLNLIPLHAISIEDDYLIEHCEISYIPSLSILNQRSNISQSNNNLFVSLSKDNLDFEAKEAWSIMGGEMLIDIDVDSFKKQIESRALNILHLSTHGHADLSTALQAYMEFENSSLTLFEIYGLKLDINLVMLSACETYLSELKGADEVLAFERAFLLAGARNVISTFLSVNTIRSQEFMEIFYEILDENESISKSFQEACIEDISNGSMEWSLFRFTGS